ncbi:hypothetical protein OXX79_013186 [Metschnikowia pulcherrima]
MKYFYIYLLLQVIAGVAEFVITLTTAAVGFPGVLFFFAICAKWVWRYIIPQEDLDYLDGAVAEPFIINSLEVPHTNLHSSGSSEDDGKELV